MINIWVGGINWHFTIFSRDNNTKITVHAIILLLVRMMWCKPIHRLTQWLFWSKTSARTLYMIWLVKCPAVLLALSMFTWDHLLLGSLLYLWPGVVWHQLSVQIETTSTDALGCYSAFAIQACNFARRGPIIKQARVTHDSLPGPLPFKF